ncbi:hypothetical protein BY996DRAFT_6593439 [Phakopsora pachyrhizi]|nr:hypothetical protein BY996DRAFT_6593439 [Phakopsora pachyrhizi]
MIFRGAFVYLCLGWKVKTLGNVVQGSRSQESLGNQCNLISHTKNSSQVQKQSHVEHQINLNAKSVDITLLAVNMKRNFKEALENKEAKPAQLPDNVQANVISPHYSTDWGEDLMLFATEWDAFPTYLMESHPAEIQHNFDTSLNGLEHSYHDYYLQGSSFWENEPWLIHQPESFGSQSGISVNDAAETQVPEHQNLGESSLADNQPLSSLVETVPTDVSARTCYSILASNFGPTQQEKTRALNEKAQSSNEIFESPHMLNLSRDSNSNIIFILIQLVQHQLESIDWKPSPKISVVENSSSDKDCRCDDQYQEKICIKINELVTHNYHLYPSIGNHLTSKLSE